MKIRRLYVIPPEVVTFLQQAIDKSPTSETIESVKLAVALDKGAIYIAEDDQIYGVVFVSLDEISLDIVLLGGKEIRKWNLVMQEFLLDLKDKHQTIITAGGRDGLGKVFPALRRVGSLYEA